MSTGTEQIEERNPNHPGEMGTDARLAEVKREPDELEARARAIRTLQGAGLPVLVGGAYASSQYTGIWRDTKDLDLFIREADGARVLEVLGQAGWRTQAHAHHWLHKAWWGEYLVDLIFASGNGLTTVDDGWFQHSRGAEVLGVRCRIPPPEEIFWSKAFVLERERYDGAELNHLILTAGRSFDWARLMERFNGYWEVLLGHLMFFRFAYPADRDVVPDWLMRELLGRTQATVREGPWDERVCRGTLLSNCNYEVDVDEWGYRDARRWLDHHGLPPGREPESGHA